MEQRAMVQNIVAVWHRATPAEKRAGRSWYRVARAHADRIAGKYGLSRAKVAAVIAGLSPTVRWELNLRQAEELIAWRQGGMHGTFPQLSTYKRNVVKVLAIMEGEAAPVWPRGPKVTAFYRLIRTGGRAEAVCVDGHAVNIALGRESSVRTPTKETVVRAVREAYGRAAKRLRVKPSTLQATTWLTWKRERAS